MQDRTLLLLLDFVSSAPKGVLLVIGSFLLVTMAMGLVFLYKCIPIVIKAIKDVVCHELVGVIGRELKLGMKNGSSVERADYIAGLFCLCLSAIAITISVSKHFSGGVIVCIIGVSMFILAMVVLVSVFLVLQERRKSEILDQEWKASK